MRALLGLMWAHPGKKLLFMGCEIGQRREWDHDGQIDWDLLDEPAHAGLQRFVGDMNRLYAAEPALHQADADPDGFEWVVSDDAINSVFAWLRRDRAGEPLLVVVNMTPVVRNHYRVGVPSGRYWAEKLNSDSALYGGSNVGNAGGAQPDANPAHGHRWSLSLTLPPLAILILKPHRQ
jgi:1,4-alpha-glucan branching enzyme